MKQNKISFEVSYFPLIREKYNLSQGFPINIHISFISAVILALDGGRCCACVCCILTGPGVCVLAGGDHELGVVQTQHGHGAQPRGVDQDQTVH